MNTDNPISTPKLSLPKGGGAIKGIGDTFAANAFAGTGTLSIPIPVSPARGLEPQLSLDYNSGSGNGIFGIGFELSLPNITRKTDKGIPKYDDSDIFILSNAEDLVPKSNTTQTKEDITWKVVTYQPRTEGSFAQIEQWLNPDGTSYWQVTTKENVTHIYGQSEAARIANPNNGSQIFSWLIEETIDSKGNKVHYHYKVGDNVGEPATIGSLNHDCTSNRYIQKIEYGNFDDKENKQYAFEIVFDYGEYNLKNDGEYNLKNPDKDAKPWKYRTDPFSSYRAGFEIRTNRLCHNILMLHHFSGEFDNKPFLVRATHFVYKDKATISTLESVQEIGYRKNGDSSGYEIKEMPPLTFNYSKFNPDKQTFKQLSTANNGPLPGRLNSQFTLIDLYGGGIPGMLYNDGTTTLYWQPQGNGRFANPVAPLQFPIHRNLPASNQALVDLDGDGQLELVVREATYGGYYQVRADKSWTPYQNFVAYPPEINTPHAEIVGLNGNGKADLLLFDEQALRIYPSKGLQGYAPPQRVSQPADFPLTPNEYAKEVLTFADMFGDGLSHRVRIRNGSVECWPDLGYGQFGSKVVFANAPHFGESFNAARLFLADIDGSGTTDLVYVHSDRVEVFFNRSGNSFADSISIALPEAYSDLDQISFGDVLGNGTSCLIFSKMVPMVRHYYFEFVSPTDDSVPQFVAGVKPYLLTEIDNNLGATTRIQYCSSTKFYLEDEKQGKPWATKLPFPVQVVEKVETFDCISKSKFVTCYKYHNGYYDHAERDFRGFAFVEQWDTEDFNIFIQPGLHEKCVMEDLDSTSYVLPVHTKRWYHTGAYTEAKALAEQLDEQCYQGDTKAYALPDCQFDPKIPTTDIETHRQAHRALRGQLIQEEIYGLDDTPNAKAPYRITASNYQVNQVQPRGEQKYAVFLVHGLESIQYEYERNPVDPRISHNFTLEVDEYGNVLKSCAVSYPRRESSYSQQTQLKAVANTGQFINKIKGFRYIGVPYESKSYEIGGLELNGKDYFNFDSIKIQVNGALTNTIRFEKSFDDGKCQARLLDWQRHYYWDDAQKKDLPLKEISARVLLHHSETAVFTPELITKVFDGKVTDNILIEDGKYLKKDDYWWNPGSTAYYGNNSNFYQLKEIVDPFGAETNISYDKYALNITSVTDALDNTVTAKIDYHTLQPQKMEDINGNTSEVRFDPLGRVQISSVYGTEGDKKCGDESLSELHRVPATLSVLLANPHEYLQEATTYFHYDLFAWQDNKQPAYAVQLVRETHVSDLAPGKQSGIQISLEYSDGFGRVLQQKSKVEVHDAMQVNAAGKIETVVEQEHSWLTTGRTVYNNKGKQVKQYEPFYTNTAEYQPEKVLTEHGVTPILHYDPLTRVYKTELPKGYLTKVEFTPWEVKHFDANDTIKEAPYFKDKTNLSVDAQQALEKAQQHYDTPTIQVLDVLGRPFITKEFSEKDGKPLITFTELDIEGNALRQIDPRLYQHNKEKKLSKKDQLCNFETTYSMSGQVLKEISADAGTRWTLYNVGGDPICHWDARDFCTTYHYDELSRLTQVEVKGNGLNDNVVEKIIYGENLTELKKAGIIGTAEKEAAQKLNLLGQPVIHYDQAGVERYPCYSFKGELLETERTLRKEYKEEANWSDMNSVQLEAETFTTKQEFDALGRVTVQIAPDKSEYRPNYHPFSGRLQSVKLKNDSGMEEVYVKDITYNAKNQREKIEYGEQNGNAVITTSYEYDPKTFELIKLKSVRKDKPVKEDESNQQCESCVQNISYTYDPVGNIVSIKDLSHETVFNGGQQVEPVSNYTYDALYRLTTATGRQHPGLTAADVKIPFPNLIPNLNDGQKLENYNQTFTYDGGGNLTEIDHKAGTPWKQWKQEMPVVENSNRLQKKEYDANGNLLGLDNLRTIEWDYRNNIARATIIERERQDCDGEYYTYNASGQRVRKVNECLENGSKRTRIEEKIYIGNYEVSRTRYKDDDDDDPTKEKTALHIMDDQERIAIVYHHTIERQKPASSQKDESKYVSKYQLGNHLGSAVLELNQKGEILTYEEYYPYGGTALMWGSSKREVTEKEYRYSGKERDTSTGLYYYGARYYAPWMGRWLSADPAGTVDGLNLFAFVGGNPVIHADLNGMVILLDTLVKALWTWWSSSGKDEGKPEPAKKKQTGTNSPHASSQKPLLQPKSSKKIGAHPKGSIGVGGAALPSSKAARGSNKDDSVGVKLRSHWKDVRSGVSLDVREPEGQATGDSEFETVKKPKGPKGPPSADEVNAEFRRVRTLHEVKSQNLTVGYMIGQIKQLQDKQVTVGRVAVSGLNQSMVSERFRVKMNREKGSKEMRRSSLPDAGTPSGTTNQGLETTWQPNASGVNTSRLYDAEPNLLNMLLENLKIRVGPSQAPFTGITGDILIDVTNPVCGSCQNLPLKINQILPYVNIQMKK